MKDASSEAVREDVNTTFREALPTRLNNPDRSAIVVIMQRLHENDVAGLILAGDFGYEHLMLPMRFEAERACRTGIGFRDPRTVDGQLLFPARFPLAVVERAERMLGPYATAGQLQQRPAPREGGLFKDAYLESYDAPPALDYRVIYVDTAQKTKEQHDFSVFQCWGKGRDGRAYLLDQVRGKFEAPELETTARAFWKKHKAAAWNTHGPLRAMKVEDKASGTGLIQSLRRPPNPVTVTPIPRSTDKVSRANDVLPSFAIGLVRVPKAAPWFEAWRSEILTFPSGAHDDQVDATIDAVADLLVRGPSMMDVVE